MSSTYQTKLEVGEEIGSFDVALQAGSLSLSLHFYWNLILQSKLDEVDRGLTEDRNGDPLVGVNYKNSDYDILDYYCTQMPYPLTLAWVNEQSVLPVTVFSQPLSQKYAILKERQETYLAVKAMRDSWEEMLAWNVTITDTSNNQATGVVRPGGTIKAEEWGWNVRFLADVSSVVKDKLGLVTVQVEVL